MKINQSIPFKPGFAPRYQESEPPVSALEIYQKTLISVRERTLASVKSWAETPEAWGWRPGPGRAHIAWQIMHIAMTEELFATERFQGTPYDFADEVPRFRGGSTVDDIIPAIDVIRSRLDVTRGRLLKTIEQFTDADLDYIAPALQQRGLSVEKAMQILIWHESHHQGQAHITYNLWKAQNAS